MPRCTTRAIDEQVTPESPARGGSGAVMGRRKLTGVDTKDGMKGRATSRVGFRKWENCGKSCPRLLVSVSQPRDMAERVRPLALLVFANTRRGCCAIRNEHVFVFSVSFARKSAFCMKIPVCVFRTGAGVQENGKIRGFGCARANSLALSLVLYENA